MLVHGAYADGLSWSAVIQRLQDAGLAVTAVQNPLTSLAHDVAHTRRVLALHQAPVILAGHSFAGTVISQAGTDPRVAGLVYIAARAPRRRRGPPSLAARFPAPPANAGLVCAAGFDALTEHAFLNDQVIMAGSGIWASDPVLVRNLTGLARVQPEALPVIAQLERGRLAAMEHLANRLHRTGGLRRDLTPAHAVDLLLISTAFAAWDELVTSRNRSPAAATAAITDLAVTAVVRGPRARIHPGARHRHVGSRKSSAAVTRKRPAGITAPDPKHSQPGQTAAT